MVIASNAEWSVRRELTFFTAIAAVPVSAAQHAYIYLTTPNAILPALVAILERLGTPILAKPFEIGILEDAVAAAATTLVLASPHPEGQERWLART